MGYLHEGHASLIDASHRDNDRTVVSDFVNPMQFGPAEDFDKYPRSLQADTAYCEQLGADLVFVPSPQEMYPNEQLTWVNTEKLTDGLCGASRPGHFRGVSTVCAKLFNIVAADIAYFGQKDAQQSAVIERMVRDLNMPLTICVCPIIREDDGLAMSSRNRYLSTDERRRALCLFQALTLCRRKIAEGQLSTAPLIEAMKEIIERNQGRIDYISIVNPQTLEPLEKIERHALILLAVYIGNTRLIDNFVIDLNNLQKPV